MKKRFKLLVAILSLVSLVSFGLAACKVPTPNPSEQQFTLVVNNDDSLGSVTISPHKSHYDYGELINITVTAKDDAHVFFGVNLNGTLNELNSNVFSFNIKENTIIEVLYKQIKPESDIMPEELFNTLKGRLHLLGNYSYDHSNDEYDRNFTIDVVYGNNILSTTESNPETGEIFYDYIYKKDNRTIKMVVRTIDNEIAEYPSDSLFKDYYNPFDLPERITASDFKKVGDGVYSVVITNDNAENIKKVATAITGWNETIAEFTVTEEDGKITKLHIVTKEIYPLQGNTEDHYNSTYDFDITEHGTADVADEKLKPFPRNAEHEILETALKTAAAAESYAVNHRGHEVGYKEPEGGETRPGYGDTNYFVYSTHDMVYDAYQGEQHGFKVLKNGENEYVYPFDYNEKTKEITLSDPVNATIESLKATFTEFKVELFKYSHKDSDGLDVYILRTNNAASFIAPCFALGNEKAQYSYATDFTIKLKNGVLNTVVFTYKTYGIEETVTLIYDFETELSFPDLDFENATKTSVFDDFVGQYKDDDGNFCEATKSGFTLNGEEVTITSVQKDNNGRVIFVGMWNGVEISISKWSSKQLLIQNDLLTINYLLTAVEPQEEIIIPDEMHGVWEIINEQEGLRYEFIIQSRTMWCNGTELPLISYNESEGLTAKYLDGTLHILSVDEDEQHTKFLHVVILDSDNNYIQFYPTKVEKDAGIEIPTDYVGAYLTDDLTVKVIIEYGSIKINGIEFKPASYSEQDGFVGIYGEYTDYTVSFFSMFGAVDKDKIVVGRDGEYYTAKRTKSLKNDYIGTWTGTYEYELTDENGQLVKDEAGNVVTVKENYLIVITDTSITVNGVAHPVKFSDEGYGYELHLENNPYTVYLLFRYNAYGNGIMVMYDDNVLLVVLTKKDVGKVDESLVGNWKNNEKAVRIDKDGKVEVKLDTKDFVKVTAEYDGEKTSFTFKYMTTSYTLSFDAEKDALVLVGGNETVVLPRFSNYTLPKTIVGSWICEDKNASMTITEDLIIIVLNGASYEIKEAEVTTGGGVTYFTFYINGVEYSAEYGTYGENLVIVEYGEKTSFFSFSPVVNE